VYSSLLCFKVKREWTRAQHASIFFITLMTLGLLFDYKLEWGAHVENLVQRINKITNGLRIIRRKFTTKQLNQIVTSQVFGVMYYSATTWLTPTLNAPLFKKLNKIHYAASRIITGDWKCIQSKESIIQQTKRLPPKLQCHIHHHKTSKKQSTYGSVLDSNVSGISQQETSKPNHHWPIQK